MCCSEPSPTSSETGEGRRIYGKLFDSMYDGTLRENWEALVTFQQMIVLCNADGVTDMTPSAIAGRTGIPIEVIEKGIAILEQPDPHSRTPDEEGRRIVRIDDHRPWGWMIVNHDKYKNLQDFSSIREQTRERVRKHRELKRSATAGNAPVTPGNGSKRHTDADTDADADVKKESIGRSPSGKRTIPADFAMTGPMREWVHSKGLPNGRWLETQTERFINHAQANGRRVVNWEAAWRNWLLKAIEMGEGGGGSNAPPDKVTYVDSDD